MRTKILLMSEHLQSLMSVTKAHLTLAQCHIRSCNVVALMR